MAFGGCSISGSNNQNSHGNLDFHWTIVSMPSTPAMSGIADRLMAKGNMASVVSQTVCMVRL
jgi:hypothetical protein